VYQTQEFLASNPKIRGKHDYMETWESLQTQWTWPL